MSDTTRRGNKTKGGSKPKVMNPTLRIVAAPEPSVVVPIARGQGKNHNGLTSKQESFAEGVGTRGETLAAAYRAAYTTENMAPATVHAEACRLMANPLVAARVSTLVQARQAKTQHDANRTRQYVIERLHLEASNESNPPSVRVRALELLGKLGDVGAFVERVSTDAVAAPSADLAATLEARLRAMLAKTG